MNLSLNSDRTSINKAEDESKKISDRGPRALPSSDINRVLQPPLTDREEAAQESRGTSATYSQELQEVPQALEKADSALIMTQSSKESSSKKCQLIWTSMGTRCLVMKNLWTELWRTNLPQIRVSMWMRPAARETATSELILSILESQNLRYTLIL